MVKKIIEKNKIVFGIIICSILLLCGCNKEETDASKLKDEYESLNSSIKKVEINKENKFIYKTIDDVISMINDKSTFVVYFGDASNLLCRQNIETLVEFSNDYNLDVVYVKMNDLSDSDIENVKSSLNYTGDLASYIFPIVDGNVEAYTNGIIDENTTSKEIYNTYKCDLKCVYEKNNTCSTEKAC